MSAQTSAQERPVAAVRRGVRWRRAALINAIGVGLIVWFASQMWMGRVAGLGSNLVIQTNKAQFNTAQINAADVAFAMTPIQVRTGASGTSTKYVLRFGFGSGKLDGFCLSQSKSILGIDYTLRISARDGSTGSFDVTGKNVQFDVTSVNSSSSPAAGSGILLKGDVGLNVSQQSVSTYKDAGGGDIPNPLDGPADYTGINGKLFGVDSSNADLYNLKGDIYDAIIEGPIDVKNLKIEVIPGSAAAQGCKNIAISY